MTTAHLPDQRLHHFNLELILRRKRIVRNPQRRRTPTKINTPIRQRPEIGNLVPNREPVGGIKEGVTPKHPRPAIHRRPQPGLGRLVAPGVMRVVDRRRDSAVQGLVQARQLAEIDVLCRQDPVGGPLAKVLGVARQRDVGAERLEAGLPAVTVRVDEAGCDYFVGNVDEFGIFINRWKGVSRNGGYTVVGDEHGAVADYLEGVVHAAIGGAALECDDGAAVEENGAGEGGQGSDAQEEEGEEGGEVHGLRLRYWEVDGFFFMC